MSLTRAAQRVQAAPIPDAYAKHEAIATQIVNLLADGAARAVGDPLGDGRAPRAADRRVRLDQPGPGSGRLRLPHRRPARATTGVDLDRRHGTPDPRRRPAASSR